LCSIFAAALIIIELQFRPPTAAVDLAGKLSKTQAKAIDVLLSLISLFVTFALSVLGGIAFFLSSALKKEMSLRRPALVLLAAAGLLSILSVFFGHLVFTAMIDMLANDILVFQATFLLWPMRLQYISLLLALSLFITAVLITARHDILSFDPDDRKSTTKSPQA
jgi:hypothetical protein